MYDINETAFILPRGFMVYEAEGKERILYANEPILNIFACATVEELMELTGGSFRGAIYKDVMEEAEKYDDNTDNVIFRIKRRDGLIRWVEAYRQRFSIQLGEFSGVFVADITEKKLQKDQQWIQDYIKNLETVFDIVRLVDVSEAVVYSLNENGNCEKTDRKCFSIWEKEHRCENCISAKVLASKGQMSKYEFIGNEPYYVISKYVELKGRAYILEMVNKVKNSSVLEAYGKENFADFIKSYNNKLYTDSLTGAYNRRYLEEQLSHLTGTTAVAMIDLDSFKKINDTYGHDAGDEALKLFVNIAKSSIRKEDTVIRLGGDEFLIVFDGPPLETLQEPLEQLCKRVSEARYPEYPKMQITLSIGAVRANDCGREARKRADHALYEAKKIGNCVKVE
ncbi:GGDEF domain-containing protein [Acetivibrio ethanolgignens]|uniref:GGDEF domain-containing protein n=1 Tax=Acetivibrio ethanolgignens TaxID=290052 RepID=A0A0V8QC66_9FIRM|nr:GGDEF domain-containing protein [Acetivibrio ethanolgignens]KSV58074.1 hypothetical protein ASU35_03300 [Acetivibrio ethanolgignens]